MSINLLVVLVIWTDPIFGSMANVYVCSHYYQNRAECAANQFRLSVFFVALADWVVFGLSPSIATYVGGLMIMIAFGLLAKHTLGEKKQ